MAQTGPLLSRRVVGNDSSKAATNPIIVRPDFQLQDIKRYKHHINQSRSVLCAVQESYTVEVDAMLAVSSSEWERFVESQRNDHLLTAAFTALGPLIGSGRQKSAAACQPGSWHSVVICAYVHQDPSIADSYHILVAKARQQKYMDWGRVVVGMGGAGIGGAGVGAAIGALGGPVGIGIGAGVGAVAGLLAAGGKATLDSTAAMDDVVLGFLGHCLEQRGHVQMNGNKYQLALGS